jgi:phage terminase small subunit
MTPMQREFCRHYANEPEAYKAMKAAGYSENYAKTKAKVMLNNEEIVTEINRIRTRMNERAEKSATDVVNEYSKIAFADRVDFLKEDPHKPGEYIYKAPHELTEEQRSIVEKVNTRTCDISIVNTETGEVESLVRQEYNYVLSDKANALQQMGRHFGIFDDKLKLVSSQQNPFKNASPEQLQKLKESFVGIMNKPKAIEGKYEEVEN